MNKKFWIFFDLKDNLESQTFFSALQVSKVIIKKKDLSEEKNFSTNNSDIWTIGEF